MEHRWGERVAVSLTVELSCGTSPPVPGSMENVSSSGAYVRTGGCAPPRGPVEVIFGERGCADFVRLPAYVVRATDVGVGIEWYEFAPRAVRQLMVGDRGSAGARALRSTLRAPRAPDTATRPDPDRPMLVTVTGR